MQEDLCTEATRCEKMEAAFRITKSTPDEEFIALLALLMTAAETGRCGSCKRRTHSK